jgi:hypothetical protein
MGRAGSEMRCVCRQTGKEDLFTNVSHPYAQRLQSVFVITCGDTTMCAQLWSRCNVRRQRGCNSGLTPARRNGRAREGWVNHARHSVERWLALCRITGSQTVWTSTS